MIPSLHLNGTSAEELLHQYEDAANGIQKALELLSYAAPHKRDYYTQGGDAWQRADREHMTRIQSLKKLQEELAEIYEAILIAQKMRANSRIQPKRV